MLIGFTGAQCTGKTTLLNLLKDRLCGNKWTQGSDGVYRDDWSFVPEVTRKVMREGLKINESGDDLTQLFILKEHLQNHTVNENENWILDRCILDGYVFTRWLHEQGSVQRWVLNYACGLLSMLGERLDYILYTEPDDIPIEDDGERSVNSQFRNDIVDIYEEIIGCSMSTPGRDTWRGKIVRLSGSVEQRMETIDSILNE